MSFDVATWKQAAAENLRRIGGRLNWRSKQDAPYLVYGTVCGLTLWPLVQAAHAGQFLPVMMALGSVAGNVGGNLIAEQIQRWKDRADRVDEAQVARWAAEQAGDPQVRAALDAILEKLEAIPQAQAGMEEADRQWFTQTLRGELGRLGNLPRFEATLVGSGAIAQGAGAIAAGAGGVAAHNIYGSVTTQYIEKQEVQTPAPDAPVEQARVRYLKRLCQRCNVLPLGALGGDEEAGDEVRLDQVYIALDTQTRVLAPEKKARQPALEPGREESSLSALEVATQERRLVLLGDPGGGKSTFVRQLAAWLADVCLGEKEPLPGWDRCPMPMLVTLRELAPRLAQLRLEGIAEDERERRLIEAVWQQWQADLQSLGAAEFVSGLEQALTDGSVVLIFDGLDEVASGMRTRVRQAVRAVLRAYPAIGRVIVTCRIRSYAGTAVLRDFATHTLAPFDENKIKQFVEAWYHTQTVLSRMDKPRAEANIQDLERAALSEDLRVLASNPMLLTTMAIIHQREVGLPRERVRLYSLAVQVLLSRWQKRKGIAVSAALAAVLSDDLKLRSIMERLGYEAHRLQSEQGQEADLSRKDVLALLENAQYLGEVGLASEFLDYCDQRAGLLVGRGGDEEGQKPLTYNFPHRTFQEYLAGCYMISGRGIDREYWKRAEEGDYWYLAGRLGAEELLYNRRSGQVLLDLAYELCSAEAPQKEAAWRTVVWSGQMAVLLGTAEVQRDVEKPGGGPVYLNRLVPRLVQVVEGNHLGPVERAEAGRVLGKLGDPRPEATTIEGMQFCYIPPGPFWMGGEGAEEHLNKHLDYGYWIGRFPVTNAQFAAFVDAGGYKEQHLWREAKEARVWQKDGQVKAWNDEQSRDRPHDFGEPFNLLSHPVVGVTWYEMLAYARWLTARLSRAGLLHSGWHVRLPSEAEWEKAARGGVETPAIPVIGGWQLLTGNLRLIKNVMPKRRFPWGDEPNTNAANYDSTGIGTTSAVGCFPGGASLCGALDMSGNVWEWMRSIYKDYPYDPKDGRENVADADVARVLRGGAFYSDVNLVRCAFRYGGCPGFRDWLVGFRVVLSPL